MGLECFESLLYLEKSAGNVRHESKDGLYAILNLAALILGALLQLIFQFVMILIVIFLSSFVISFPIFFDGKDGSAGA